MQLEVLFKKRLDFLRINEPYLHHLKQQEVAQQTSVRVPTY